MMMMMINDDDDVVVIFKSVTYIVKASLQIQSNTIITSNTSELSRLKSPNAGDGGASL